MDTTTTKQEKNWNYWTNSQKTKRCINNKLPPNILKILPNGRVIYKFYTGTPDTVSLNKNKNGTLLISSRIEKM